ncbi:glycine/D-amino acid oxidase-like deaminating enzyme [Hoeflea marina]|uniref:Glycine/D-amino acid oxidase-like deaminating enzyme n=1 Tax=Hoeflea marina TaxID=274592 RepID=A0A317PF17_9HYPH|nr:FAD-binding oxidoreductase [Hoeflea marina]PWV98230.1 glycine/D-amino acid oxidase-like deaminating enzyme [Hoeflea marina]
MQDEDFTADVKMTPYWWETSPREATARTVLPATADVVVVGSGYTGLNAALQMARGGRNVVVCDAEAAGWGCSTRNGGQISTSVKPGFETLARRHGDDVARRVMQDGRDSLRWIEDFVESESIDCDFGVVGRFHVAHNEAALRKLTQSTRNQPAGFEVPAHVISRAEQRTELGTDAYCGGVVFPNHASLDPGRYHAGLMERVRAAGATIVPFCKVNAIVRDGTGFDVATASGRIRTRNVVIATNAYSGPLSRWHQRRIIPIGSYVIATEEIPEALMDELIPRNRVISDTRRVLYYFRASPDRRRILFGGRVSMSETDPRRSGRLLRRELVRLFPQLHQTRVSHSWMGFVGYTFDELAHTGQQDGVHYAMGYCGSGVGMASYLGMRTGQRVLGLPEGETGYGATGFPARRYYTGNPWFLAPAINWYRIRDRINL